MSSIQVLWGIGTLLLLASCASAPQRREAPKKDATAVIPEDPDAPIPYPAPEISAARLLARSREAAWKPLPAHAPQRADELMTELLTRFTQRSDFQRRAAREQGNNQMPALQGQNWREFLEGLDELMLRVPAENFDSQLLRARKTLEAEMEADAATYAEMPSTIVDEVLERETKFGLHALQLARSQRRESKIKPFGVPDEEDLYDGEFPLPLDGGRGFLAWPVAPIRITSLFGRRFHPIHKVYKPHQGVDLAAAIRQDVMAAASGVVVRAGWAGNHGNLVQIKHSNGAITGYSHLTKVLVKAGAKVQQGERIGLAGRTGGATGPHLHFELWRNGVPEDPLQELGDPPQEQRVSR